MGICLIDNGQLGRLAEARVGRQRWEFFFALAPRRLEQGACSPVNPIAPFKTDEAGQPPLALLPMPASGASDARD